LFFGAKLWGMGCTHHAARRFEQRRRGYLDALERNRGCASAYFRSRALTLAMAASISPARLAWASTGNPGCRISPLLGRFAPHAGLVTLRQTFVLRSHGGNCRCRAVKDEQWDLLSPEF
jgi:hypothetical protein